MRHKTDHFLTKEWRLHGLKVSELCKKIALFLILDKDYVEILSEAGKIHDIGKFYIPEYVLNAKRPLSLMERMVVDMHSYYGYMQLLELGYPDIICQLVLMHHGEKRYRPDNIQIHSLIYELYPILLAADMYDALRSDRVYRQAMEKGQALSILKDHEEISEDILCALSVIDN